MQMIGFMPRNLLQFNLIGVYYFACCRECITNTAGLDWPAMVGGRLPDLSAGGSQAVAGSGYQFAGVDERGGGQKSAPGRGGAALSGADQRVGHLLRSKPVLALYPG